LDLHVQVRFFGVTAVPDRGERLTLTRDVAYPDGRSCRKERPTVA
jgi:hypothetical protein